MTEHSLTTAAERDAVSAAGESFAPWPEFDDELIEAAANVLRSGRVNYWTGDEGRGFEQEFAAFVDTEHAVAVANGTLALELALQGLGIGPGDEVIVPSRTFMASASCAVMRGAIPVIADIDRDSQNLTAATIEPLLTERTKAIIAVHLGGWPCDMDPIMELASSRGIKVIEDCAQAHGARYKGRPVGSIGHVGAFSFCQDKILTTGGEGGMLTTSDSDLWERAWSYKDHGKSWQAVHARPDPSAVFKWLHESFGTNWRLTEMQSAMGRILLRRLPDWVTSRRRNAARIDERLSSIPALRTVAPPEQHYHSYYKHYAFVRPELLKPGWDRNRIVHAIQDEGVPCGCGSCGEIYLEKAFESAGLQPPGRLPVARELSETSLMFQVHPTLTQSNVDRTCQAVSKVLGQATDTGRLGAKAA